MPESVTQLLGAWRDGSEDALEKLAPLVYDELRRLARGYMARERRGMTMQATELVNEAFKRLVVIDVPWQDRAHFIAVSARLMRRILVDHARARATGMRDSGQTTLPLDSAPEVGVAEDFDILALDEALMRLAELDERKANVVELSFFGGLTYDEIAETLDISAATVDRDLRMAKAWLHEQLTSGEDQ